MNGVEGVKIVSYNWLTGASSIWECQECGGSLRFVDRSYTRIGVLELWDCVSCGQRHTSIRNRTKRDIVTVREDYSLEECEVNGEDKA